MPDQLPPEAPPPRKNPVWPWALVVAGVAAMLGSAAIGVRWVRENARRANCKQTLRSIGLCCHIYADDNDDEFPENLQQFYPNYVDNAKLFSCPSHPSSYQDFASGKVTERSSSYVLLPGRCAEMPGAFFLIYEKPENHRWCGFHVVYTDAHVEWWPAKREAEFQKLLAEQRTAVEEWRKAHPPVK